MKNTFIISSIVFLFLSLTLRGQGTKEDYARAENFRELIKGKALNLTADVLWLPGKHQVFYSRSTSTGKEFILADLSRKTKQPAFDHPLLAKRLGQLSGKAVDPGNLPLSQLSFPDSSSRLQFAAFDKGWWLDLGSGELKHHEKFTEELARRKAYWGNYRKKKDDDEARPWYSPDSQWVARIKNHNVYLCPKARPAEERALSVDGGLGEFYEDEIIWSPDSKSLVVNKIRPGADHTLYLLESSPKDQLQPKLQTRDYLKPGDALSQKSPTLFSLERDTFYRFPKAWIENQFSLSRAEWRRDSRSFTVEYNQRGHQLYAVLEMDAKDGGVRELIRETSVTFIDYSGKKYRYDVADGRETVWASERDGWNHLYLYDADGKVKNQITKGDWVVRRIIHVDEKNRQVLFSASGMHAGQDPYLLQYYRVNFDGSKLTPLTDGATNHETSFSSDFAYFVDEESRVDQQPETVIRDARTGKLYMDLEKSDLTALEAVGWKAPEVFQAKGRDGKTDIWGIIVRPTNFDASKVYPVIEYIYAGPHSSFVPKRFSPAVSSGMQELAELGFIVVQMDGMGTSNRSKAFHDLCWQNLKDAGFPDRIAWMKAAAAAYPYMDLDRVGIYGTSAGGQSSAGALLFHGDFYKVAVSSCGCHDNRMDKIWWNEQWMGYPIGSHYAASSNVVNAHRLKGKLMLIVGELDDNVDPASTLQVVDALIKAGKNFDFLMVPGMGHSSGGDFGEHKRRDYFVKHLLGVEPPSW